ncbi:Hsp20/alpha crystallin family protein [bacterium]|nr:Hsp20/alpha crystallin family protein [bacterium]
MRYLIAKPDSFLTNLENDIENDFQGFFSRERKADNALFVPIDLKEFENEYEVQAELPGVKKEDVDIDITKNHLRITAKKECAKEEKHKKYARTEFSYGSMSRTLYFPEDIKVSEATAKMEHGILKIVLPKVENEESKHSKLNIE